MNIFFEKLKSLRILNISKDIEGVGILFENDLSLSIYNPFSCEGFPEDSLPSIIGEKLEKSETTKDEAIFYFSGGKNIRVNLREKAWKGPEAMYLTGPDNLMVVWN